VFYFLRLLGFVWLLPVTILVWTFYVLPLAFLDEIRWDGWHSFLVARFRLVDPKEGIGSWYYQQWHNWAGWSGPCVLVYKNASIRSLARGLHAAPHSVLSVLKHEERHCVQQFLFGPLFYPIYFLSSVVLWVYGEVYDLVWGGYPAKSHPYYDNPFERDARRAAGGVVDIPPHMTGVANDNRWPWW
jgi:hypothetical protein